MGLDEYGIDGCWVVVVTGGVEGLKEQPACCVCRGSEEIGK